MAIIYTYPSTSSLEADDLLLISDDSDGKKTKSVSLGTIKSFVGGGSAAFLTVQTENGGTIVNNVVDIKVTNNTLTDNGNGVVTIDTGGGSGTPGGDQGSIQYNDNSAFEGSANLIFNGTDKLDVTHMVDIKGDGTNSGKLKIYCQDNTTPHYVEIEGPEHGVSGQSNYTIKLPAVAPTDGQILEYVNNATGYEWKTPATGGLTETAGVWYPILGTQAGVNASLQYQSKITNGTRSGTWRRIGKQMYYDFYIEFTITAEYQSGNLVIGQSLNAGDNDNVYPLPVDTTEPSTTNPTLANNLQNNGSCQITQATSSDNALMWYYMPQTGKVGRTTAGIVDLASHNFSNAFEASTLPYILHTEYSQQWWTGEADNGTCVLAGTIIGVASS